MLELKHVPLDKSVSDLLIGPCDKQLVVMVGLSRKKTMSHVTWMSRRLLHAALLFQ